MNKHIKGFNISKINHMRINQGFSETKFNDNASQTGCLYWKKYPLTTFFQLFQLFLVIFEIKHKRKIQGFSEKKFNDNASQTGCLYDSYIFRTWKNTHWLLFSIILIIFRFF